MAHIEEGSNTLKLDTKRERTLIRTMELINLIKDHGTELEFTTNLYANLALQELDTAKYRQDHI